VQIESFIADLSYHLHQARNDWAAHLPDGAGLRSSGRLTQVARGDESQADDFAGVGCMVDSCRRARLQ